MKLLIVEDERAFRQVLEEECVKENIDVVGVGTGAEALEQLEQGDFDIVVTDLRLPDTNGIDIIETVRGGGNDIPFLLMTAYASVKTAVTALKMGAADYLIKPVRVPDLVRRVKQVHDLDRLQRENSLLKKIVQRGDKGYWFPDTEVSQRIQQLISKVSNTDMTVLISGQSGTGKGVTARVIHSASSRSENPFVAVNCGAIPETLVESELFGHVKGAFTDASSDKDGLFVAASSGTLFLDEIGELSLAVQVKILTVLEEKIVRPIGSTKDRKTNVRIIAATNKNLSEMVSAGTFREDLFYRLNVFQIALPSLQEQKEALPSAVDFIINKYSDTYDVGEVEIAPDVWECFNSYEWPGNFRELNNVIERALLLRDSKDITLSDLPPALVAAQPRASKDMTEELMPFGDFKTRVQAFEKHLITQAIKAANDDRRLAAQSLGIGLSTLYRKLEE